MIEERKIGGFSLFSLWAGAAISLAEIMTGSLIAPLGMKKGIIIILLGHLIGCLLLSSAGIIGFKEKKPALLSSRKSLGRYGSYLISIFNIIQLVGWTAIMLIQCARSVQSITVKLFGFNNLSILVVITGIIVGIWALYADKGVNLVNNIAVMLLFILSIIMFGVMIKNGHAIPAKESMSFGMGLELSIVMPLSWIPLISDYTMASKSNKGSFFGSFLGYFTGSSFMYAVGLVTAIYAGASDPIGVLNKMNMGLAALLIVVLATVTTTFLDVYSAVMSTINLTSKFSKKALIILFTVFGILLALVFPMELYENFLYLIGSVFAPIFSVILIDYFIIKADRSDSIINIPGIISAALGTVVYYIVIKYNSPIGATMPSMAASAALYAALIKLKGDMKYVK